VTGDDDWEANLWHAESGELHAKLFQDGNASSVDFSADGASLIVACEDAAWVNMLEIKKLETRRKSDGVLIHRFGSSSLLHRSRLLQAKFSPDATNFVSTSADGLIRVWAPGKPIEPIRKWTFSKSVTYVTLSVDGNRMVTAEVDGTVTWFNLKEEGEQAATRVFHSQRLRAIALASDGRKLMTGCADGIVRIWDCELPEQNPIEIPMGSAVDSIALFNQRRELIVACGNGEIRKIDLATNEFIGPQLHDALLVNCFAVSADEKSLACGTNEGELIVREIETLQTRYTQNHRGRINSLAYSSDNSKIVSSSADGTAIVWEAATGLSLSTLAYGREVTSARFYGNDEFVLLAGYGGEASLWSVETGKTVGVAFPHPEFISRCVVDYSKNEAVTACRDGIVRVWQLPKAMSIESNRVSGFLENRTGLQLTRKGVAKLYDPAE